MKYERKKVPPDELLKTVEIYARTGSLHATARELGMDRNAIRGRLQRAAEQGISTPEQQIATLHGINPEHDLTHAVPAPLVLKGTSTLYGEDGKPKLQWVKTRVDHDRVELAIREWIASLTKSVEPLPPVDTPKHSDDSHLSVYPVGDAHFGLYAWAAETGDDFDLATAERLTKGAVDKLVSMGPPSAKGLLLSLGDYFHADDSSNKTPAHGNALDIDTRYAKVMQTGLSCLIYCIRRLLEKHEEVTVWMIPGNHDPHASYSIALCLSAFFAENPRVKIDLNPGAYKYMRFGNVLIGSHHGDGAKANDLPLIMAHDRPEDWGASKHRYWYVGHIHHKSAKEYPGVIVESFRTLAGKDAWHAMKGYRSGRDMNLIVHSKTHGEVLRARCDVGMIQ